MAAATAVNVVVVVDDVVVVVVVVVSILLSSGCSCLCPLMSVVTPETSADSAIATVYSY